MHAEAFAVAPYLEKLLGRTDLTSAEASELLTAIVDGRVGAASIAAISVALRAKGETAMELAAFAAVMRSRVIPVSVPVDTLDTCGTGGDQSGTFNISTATALVVAGMGIHVAKHGGRSASSRSGSADVLKELGVNIDVLPACVEKCIKLAGIGFMFAPAHHPAMKHVAPVRKELGVRTCFNLLGPLANPARSSLQVLGVWDPSLCGKLADVLRHLGSRDAMVVCGAGPGGTGFLDEMSTFGPTCLARLHEGTVRIEEFDARALGFAAPPAEALFAPDAESSARMIRQILAGQPGPAREIVLLNAAAAGVVSGKAADWREGVRLAARSIDDGKAANALKRLIALTNE